MCRPLLLWFLGVWLVFAAGSSARGEQSIDHAVRISARVYSASPPALTLIWLRSADATAYIVAKRPITSAVWGRAVTLPAGTTQYVDRAVAAGVTYEYLVQKRTRTYTATSYVCAGINPPIIHDRGKVLLLVESQQAEALAAELDQLQEDLAGDGWTVLRRDVDRNATAASVKEVVRAVYTSTPGLKTLFIFGHVPVPYSGLLAPDGHNNHKGAWPADVYYGEFNGQWTDAAVDTRAPIDPRNHNTPRDGKFDQSVLPGPAALEIGRVDFANMPTFQRSETDLLRQYLTKDHLFRQNQLNILPFGLIDDRFGIFNGRPFAANAWSNFGALLSPSRLRAGFIFPGTVSQSYLMAYVCGPGQWTSCGVDTANSYGPATFRYAAQSSNAVFVGMLGSYFGDWDHEDSLLRAPLANRGAGLAVFWTGLPNWYLQHFGRGYHLGLSARISQNNAGAYPAGGSPRGVHVALMGDPTLRLHPVSAPTNVRVTRANNNANRVSWTAPSVAPLGYQVYRSTQRFGPYTKLTAPLLRTLEYVDPAPSAGAYYQVRAIHLQAANGGTYWNPSQGAFAQGP